MSKNSFNLFPELDELRLTLRQFQNEYAGNKPELSSQLKLVHPPVRTTTQLNAVVARSESPMGGGVPTRLLQAITYTRQGLERLLVTLSDPEAIANIGQGAGFDSGIYMLLEPFNWVAYDAISVGNELDQSIYGASQIELRHILAKESELLVLMANALFEVVEVAPDNQIEASALGGFMSAQASIIKNLCQRQDQGFLLKFLASWLERWHNRPVLSVMLQTWFEVARVDLKTSRNIDNYRPGDRLVELTVFVGHATSVRISQGRLPFGWKLTSQGHIEVEHSAKMLPGLFGGLVLSGETNLGINFDITLPDIEIGHDVEAGYIINPSKALSDYVWGEVLAYPEDLDGDIVEAQVVSGNFPNGVRFDTNNGQFTVSDPLKLKQGSFDMQVVTIDSTGGLSEYNVEISFGEEFTGGRTFNVTYGLPRITLPVVNGQVIGQIQPDGVTLHNVTAQGSGMPNGFSLRESDGQVTVSASEFVVARSSSFIVTGLDPVGNRYVVDTKLRIQEPSLAQRLSYTFSGIRLPLATGHYLGQISITGQTFSSCSIAGDPLPDGLALSTFGVLSVTDGNALQPTSFSTIVNATMGYGQSAIIDLNIIIEDQIATVSNGPTVPLVILKAVLPLDPTEPIYNLQFDMGPIIDGEILWNIPSGLSLEQDGNLFLGSWSATSWRSEMITVRLVDESGLERICRVGIDLTELEEPGDTYAYATFTYSTQDLPLEPEMIIGQATANDLAIVSHTYVAGAFFKGTNFDQNGFLTVVNPNLMMVGQQAFRVLALAENDEEYLLDVRMSCTSALPFPGEPEIKQIVVSLSLAGIPASTTVARLTYGGEMLSNCSFLGGLIPQGMSFGSNGELTLMTPEFASPEVGFCSIEANYGNSTSVPFIVKWVINS